MPAHAWQVGAPTADQSAIAFVLPAPDQSAVISASVVGNAIPAATPPSRRARIRTSGEGASAASNEAGIASFYWVDQGFGYALSGKLPRQGLLVLAESVYRQL